MNILFYLGRHVIMSKDKKQILTHKGFKDVNNLGDASPKLFPNLSAAKVCIATTYDNNENLICVEVNVKYETN